VRKVTNNYVEPGGGATIADGIATYLVRHELRSPADISGKLRVSAVE